MSGSKRPLFVSLLKSRICNVMCFVSLLESKLEDDLYSGRHALGYSSRRPQKNPGLGLIWFLGPLDTSRQLATFLMTQRLKIRKASHVGHLAILSFEKYYLSNIVELSADDKGGQRG